MSIFILEHKTTNLFTQSIKSEIQPIKTSSKDPSTNLEAALREVFKVNRTDTKPLVDPHLHDGEVMALEDSETRDAWIVWVDTGNRELQLLSKINMDVFTDLVIELRHCDSEWIGQRMLEEDPVYRWLKDSPTVPSTPSSANGKYVFAK